MWSSFSFILNEDHMRVICCTYDCNCFLPFNRTLLQKIMNYPFNAVYRTVQFSFYILPDTISLLLLLDVICFTFSYDLLLDLRIARL